MNKKEKADAVSRYTQGSNAKNLHGQGLFCIFLLVFALDKLTDRNILFISEFCGFCKKCCPNGCCGFCKPALSKHQQQDTTIHLKKTVEKKDIPYGYINFYPGEEISSTM